MDENREMYLIITADQHTSIEEIDLLTKELSQALAQSKEEVADVCFVQGDQLPPGTKTVGLLFAEQAVIKLIPIVTPWVLAKIHVLIKSISTRMQKKIRTTVLVGSHEIHINPETTSQELAQFTEIVKSAESLTNNRYALVIGNSVYLDSTLPPLNSADLDAKMLADVLMDGQIGAFNEVTTLINKDSLPIMQSIESFFQNRQKDDLMLLYFSGHGIKSNSGQLFLAAQNTKVDLVRSTGVPSSFIKENMDSSNSQRQVLILDCCYSGSIVEGAKSEQIIGQSAMSVQAFQTSGFGRVIMAASEAMQYAYDGQHFEGRTENSLFTNYLIEGLRTGRADNDNNGLIDVDELFHYAYRNVIPKQTPNISTRSQKGKMYISINPNPTIRPAELPTNLKAALKNEDRLYRQGAILELKDLLNDKDSRKAIAAEIALKNLLQDDSYSIRLKAMEALQQPHRTSQSKTDQNRGDQITNNVPQTPTGPRLPSPVPQQMEKPVPHRKETEYHPVKPTPILAALLSLFLLGGMGQLYLKQYKKGLALIVGMIIFSSISFPFLFLFIPFFLMIAISAADAYGTAEKIANGSTVEDWEFNINWKVVGTIVLIFSLLIACPISLYFLMGGL
jgi:uncharacterized caspase-like protein/TM2 domain-containing membrane protein YozV